MPRVPANNIRLESSETPAQFPAFQFPATVWSTPFGGGWLIEGYYLHPTFNDYVLIDILFFRKPTGTGTALLQRDPPTDDEHAQVYAYVPSGGGLNWFSFTGKVSVAILNGALSVVLNDATLANGTTNAKASANFIVTLVDKPVGFSGATGTTWEPRASGGPRSGGFTDFTAAGTDGFFSIGSSRAAFRRYKASNNTWSAPLDEPRRDTDGLEGTAWVGGSLYLFNGGLIEEYNIAANSWTTLARRVPFTGQSPAAHDDTGGVYALTPVQSHGWWHGRRTQNVIRWDIAKKEWNILSTPRAEYDGRGDNPVLTWDTASARLFLADRDEAKVRRYDPRTQNGVQDKPHPEGAVGFLCSDRNGHLYAGGDFRSRKNAKTLWQFTVVSATWKRIPDLPFAKDAASACTVTGDGWLYVSDGRGGTARIQLL